MTTISVDEQLQLTKTHFSTLDELESHIVMLHQNSELSQEHRRILDKRLINRSANPTDVMSLDDLKREIKRR